MNSEPAQQAVPDREELMRRYYAQADAVRNAQRTLYAEQVKLKKIRLLLLAHDPSQLPLL